jgi:hypothetical protein
MLKLVKDVTRFPSRPAWENAWYAYGKALGRRNSPAIQRDTVEMDAPGFPREWHSEGITFVTHQAREVDPPPTGYKAWGGTTREVFSQLPLALSVDFGLPTRELGEVLRSATDPEAVEICCARVMIGLSRIVEPRSRALVVMTDSMVQPHDWTRYPRRKEELLLGLTFPWSGVVVAKIDFHSPRNVTIPAHEVFHLLGFTGHHGNYAVPGYPEEECVMQRHPRTTHLCRRDWDALRAFWGGVEETTGRRFLL